MASRDQDLPDGDKTEVDSVEKYCPTCDGSFPIDAVHCPNDGTRLVRLTPAVDPLLGVVIDGRFRIKARLGAGGMGAVYRAWQGSVGRDVAVKLIEARLSQGKMAAKRFLRESKLTSRLSHPNTVTVLDFGQTEDGMLYLVMELVRGRTLNTVLTGEGRFSVSRMVRVAVQLCDALEAAHGLSIIHRDLKPSNIIVLDEPKGRDHIKVLDFGLAKSLAGDDHATTMTHSDAIMGTPAYISPEAALASGTDERSDLYSLGVILYELVAGRLPFSAETVNVMISRHAHDPPTPLGTRVSPELEHVLMRLLEKKPEDRYQTAAQVRDALLALPGVDTAGLAGDSRPPRSARSVNAHPLDDTVTSAEAQAPPPSIGASQLRRPRWPWITGAAVLALLAAGAFWLVQRGGSETVETPVESPAETAPSQTEPSPPAAAERAPAPAPAAVAAPASDASPTPPSPDAASLLPAEVQPQKSRRPPARGKRSPEPARPQETKPGFDWAGDSDGN